MHTLTYRRALNLVYAVMRREWREAITAAATAGAPEVVTATRDEWLEWEASLTRTDAEWARLETERDDELMAMIREAGDVG